MRQSLQSRSLTSPARHSIIEPLETRQMMTAVVLKGTAGNDTFNLSYLEAANSITYDGKGGHDTINVVTPWNGETVLGSVTLKNSNGGKWSINVNDLAVKTDHAIKVGNGQISGAVSGTINYSANAVEQIYVAANSRTTSTLDVTDCPAGVDAQFNLVGKYKAKVTDTAGTLAAFKGSMFFQGNNDSTLSISDLSNTKPQAVTLTPGAVAGLTPNPIYFIGFRESRILTGSGDKTVKVLGSNAGTTFASFDGNVKMTVGDHGSLKDIQSPLHLINYFGKTDVTIDDSKATTGATYVVNADGLSFEHSSQDFGSVTFDGRHSVTLLTSKAHDDVTINNTNANDFVLNTGAGLDYVTQYASTGNTTIEAGNGNDVGDYVYFGASDKGSLSKFAKTTTVHGASMVDLSDHDETLGHTYALNTYGLSRDGAPKFKFTSMYTRFYCGTGNDTFDGSLAANTPYTIVVGNAGNDKLIGTPGDDTIFGGMGNDTVVSSGGSDKLWGDGLNSAIFGNDLIDTTGATIDTIAYGDAGEDTLRYDAPVESHNIENYVHTATLTGKVFIDVDKDGLFNGQDFGAESVRVWIDLNGNGVYDKTDRATYSDPKGYYTLRDIDPGYATIRVTVPYGGYTTNNHGKPLTQFYLSGVHYDLDIGVNSLPKS